MFFLLFFVIDQKQENRVCFGLFSLFFFHMAQCSIARMKFNKNFDKIFIILFVG